MSSAPIHLIASAVHESFAPPNLTLECTWEIEGVKTYSRSLCTADDLYDLEFWLDQENEMVKWFASRKRKHGEIACIRT